MSSGRGADSSILRLLRIVRERWWVVVASIVVCVALALLLAARTQKEYDATSKLLFRQSALDTAVSNSTVFPSSSDPARDAFTNVSLITSNEVAAAANKQVGLDTTPEATLAKITVQQEENANVADVTVRDPSPKQAALLADAVADQYVIIRRDQDRARVNEGVKYLRASAKELLRTGQRGELLQVNEALKRLVALAALQTGGAEVVDRATVPSTPATPKIKRDVILGLIFGLALGLSLAFVLDVLDNRLKTPEDVESELDTRVLTVVPQRAFEARSDADRAAAFEPYRILRGALDFRMLSDDLSSVLIAGPSGGEGATTVAVNLARAFAVAGQRVAVVEANLRRPAFGTHFQLPAGSEGLTSVLVGERPLQTVLRRSGAPGLEGLLILPAGPLPPNPAELLESRAMHEVLEELTTLADLVIIDAPPLLPVADARILLDHPRVDASLAVARVFKTTRQEARRMRAVFEQHGREPLGAVVTGVKNAPPGMRPNATVNGSGAKNRIRPVPRLGAPREPAGTPKA